MTSTTGSMNEQYKKKEHIDRTRELFWSQTYHPLKYGHGLPWKGTGQCVSTWQRRHSALRSDAQICIYKLVTFLVVPHPLDLRLNTKVQIAQSFKTLALGAGSAGSIPQRPTSAG